MFDFLANRIVKDLSGVPSEFQTLYEEAEDGSFALSSDPKVSGAIAALTGMQGALKASRSEAKELGKKQVDLSPLSEWGEDPATIAANIKARDEELTAQIAKGKGATLDLDKLKEAMGSAHANELKARDVAVTNLENQLHTELVTNRATAAILAAKGNPLLLMPHLNKSVQTVKDETGKYAVHVVDEAGARRFSGVTGEHMTIEERVAEMKGDAAFGVCFASDAPAGGGTKPGGATPPRVPQDKMSAMEKISAGLEKRR